MIKRYVFCQSCEYRGYQLELVDCLGECQTEQIEA